MDSIYTLTRINYDHVFATLIRHQGNRSFTERRYRNRIFLCIHALMQKGDYQLHDLLEDSYKAIIYEDPSPKFREFIDLSIHEGVIKQDGDTFQRDFGKQRGKEDFHRIRAIETTHVIANEAEPVEGFSDLVKGIAHSSKKDLSLTIRSIFLEEDHRIFEDDYLEYRSKESKHMDVGRPFLLIPERFKAGIVLVHGYMAAPKEVRALANSLYDQGYLVYGVRLKGHGTAPEDLARVKWQDWYESLNRGYVVTKSYTDKIIIGGFSTGGGLALMAAGLKKDKIQAVFSINAPLKLRQFKAKLAPSVASINALLQKIKGTPTGWEFVGNSPENKDINYERNPLSGVRELSKAMDAVNDHLPNIVVPTLILQGSDDPVVDPSSAMDIFRQVGTSAKVLTYLERPNHGIINGDQCEDVFDRVHQFLNWAAQQEIKCVPRELDEEIRVANMLMESAVADSA